MKIHLFFLALIGIFIFCPLSIHAQDENILDPASLVLLTVDNAAEISELNLLEHKSSISDIAFSPDGNMLASASFQEGLSLWKIEQLQEPPVQIGGNFSTVAFSPNGELLALGGEDSGGEGCECTFGSVHLYDATTYQQRAVLVGLGSQGETDINHLTFDKDNKQLVTVDALGYFGLWDVDNALQLGHLEIHEDMYTIQNDDYYTVWAAIISPVENILAYSISRAVPNREINKSRWLENQIVLWDMDKQSQIQVLEGHTNLVNVIAFSSDGALLASGSGELIGYQDNYAPIYSDDNSVRLWNVETGEQIVVLGFESEISDLAFSSDGRLLAVGDYGHIHIVDAKNGIELSVLNGHTGLIEGLAFSPDGKLLASGGDSTVRIWGVRH